MRRFFNQLTLCFSLAALQCMQHASIGESPTEASASAVPMPPPLHGLKGEYFKSLDWTGTPVAVRIDPLLDLNWEFGMPVLGLPEAFSARWTGEVEAPFDDTYTVVVSCDDGCWLVLDGVALLDYFSEGASSSVVLTKGRHSIEVRLVSHAGYARVNVVWSSPLLPKEIIPSARLYPAR